MAATSTDVPEAPAVTTDVSAGVILKGDGSIGLVDRFVVEWSLPLSMLSTILPLADARQSP
jgi:hypothetical protein